LKWRDVQVRADGQGQVTVLGKGSKTRAIVVPSSVNDRLGAIHVGSDEDAAVFLSRRKRPISASQVLRIVKAAAKRAGISRNVVNHMLRHCHASHALERGAPIHLVQQTLGHADLSTTGRYLHARPADSSGRYLPR
jgi:integrase/recombinase XerD